MGVKRIHWLIAGCFNYLLWDSKFNFFGKVRFSVFDVAKCFNVTVT